MKESDWAAEHLQTIRTLMERSAIYRRALAPVMLLVGSLGCAAAVIGYATHLQSGRAFIGLWLGVSLIAISGALLLIRRQAVKAAEPFWTPPTRKVAEAIAPPLCFGAAIGLLLLMSKGGRDVAPLLLPPAWMALYGCALNAAGFFMARGIRMFGWLFIIVGGFLLAFGPGTEVAVFGSEPESGHIVMGATFGGLHLAYGIYLYFTEKRGNES